MWPILVKEMREVINFQKLFDLQQPDMFIDKLRRLKVKFQSNINYFTAGEDILACLPSDVKDFCYNKANTLNMKDHAFLLADDIKHCENMPDTYWDIMTHLTV